MGRAVKKRRRRYFDRRRIDLALATRFWGTIAAYFPGQDIAISIAVTQQQSRALFRVFVDALTLLEESASGG